MRCAVRRLGCLAPVVLVASFAGGCGGASDASSSRGANAPKGAAADTVSIGDTAIAEGGLTSLGGGRNKAGAAGSSGTSGAIHFDRVDRESPVKMDGTLREWPARSAAKTVLEGDGSKTSFSVGLQYDDARIYFGGEVGDDAFVRSARFAATEDHAVLTLAFPVGTGALAAYEIAFYPGEPGESTGSVRFASGARRGQEVPGAKIIEAPAQGGYSFEASFPWAAFPEGRTTRVGLRGAARYVDADSAGHVRAVIASAQGDAAHASTLPSLPTEPEVAMIEGLLAPKGLLGETPKFDIVADIAGDGMKERISVYTQFLTICGPRYRDGKQYFFRDLGSDIVRLDARAITGRAKEDLAVTRRYDLGGATRQVFEVWSVLKDSDEPQTVFAHEVAITSGGKHVDNAVHVSGRDIEVGYEPPVGWDVASFREPTSSDVEPLILPWAAVKTQTFRFDGAKFAKVREVAQTPSPGAAGAPQPKDGFANTLAEARKEEPATPTVAKGGDLSADVFALYKRDHNVAPGTKPRFDLSVHIGGDARPERVVVVGRDIVVFGPGFKNGTGYGVLSLSQFASDDDIQDVSARDLTGDGAADIVVRGVRRVTAGGAGHSVEVGSIFVYQLDGDQLTRIFGIETGREQGKKRVQGLVQFVPADDHKSFEVDVRPGIARGWTERTYPWQQEQPGGQMEPLLLPWGGVPSLRYAWDGSKFAVKN